MAAARRRCTQLTSIAPNAALISPAESDGHLYTMDTTGVGDLWQIEADGSAHHIAGASTYPVLANEKLDLSQAQVFARGGRVIFNSRTNYDAEVVFSDGSHAPRRIYKHSAVQVDPSGATTLATGSTQEHQAAQTGDQAAQDAAHDRPAQPVNEKVNCTTTRQTPHIPIVQLGPVGSRSVQLQWTYPLLDPQDCAPSTYTVSTKLNNPDAPAPPGTITVNGADRRHPDRAVPGHRLLDRRNRLPEQHRPHRGAGRSRCIPAWRVRRHRPACAPPSTITATGASIGSPVAGCKSGCVPVIELADHPPVLRRPRAVQPTADGQPGRRPDTAPVALRLPGQRWSARARPQLHRRGDRDARDDRRADERQHLLLQLDESGARRNLGGGQCAEPDRQQPGADRHDGDGVLRRRRRARPRRCRRRAQLPARVERAGHRARRPDHPAHGEAERDHRRADLRRASHRQPAAPPGGRGYPAAGAGRAGLRAVADPRCRRNVHQHQRDRWHADRHSRSRRCRHAWRDVRPDRQQLPALRQCAAGAGRRQLPERGQQHHARPLGVLPRPESIHLPRQLHRLDPARTEQRHRDQPTALRRWAVRPDRPAPRSTSPRRRSPPARTTSRRASSSRLAPRRRSRSATTATTTSASPPTGRSLPTTARANCGSTTSAPTAIIDVDPGCAGGTANWTVHITLQLLPQPSRLHRRCVRFTHQNRSIPHKINFTGVWDGTRAESASAGAVQRRATTPPRLKTLDWTETVTSSLAPGVTCGQNDAIPQADGTGPQVKVDLSACPPSDGHRRNRPADRGDLHVDRPLRRPELRHFAGLLGHYYGITAAMTSPASTMAGIGAA